MNGRYSVTDLMGRCYWRTNDQRDAYETALELGRGIATLIIVDDKSGRREYVRNGQR